MNLRYNLDFLPLIKIHIPVDLRTNRRFEWLWTLSKGVRIISDEVNLIATKAEYNLKHNSQILSLEEVVNDQFDDTLRRIYITSVQRIGCTYIYRRSENRPMYLYCGYDNARGYNTAERVNYLSKVYQAPIAQPPGVNPVAGSWTEVKTRQYIRRANERIPDAEIEVTYPSGTLDIAGAQELCTSIMRQYIFAGLRIKYTLS